MTAQEHRQTADAIESIERGVWANTQWRKRYEGEWVDHTSGDDAKESIASGRMVRIKPSPRARPWSKPQDVPGPVCWIRRIEAPSCASLEAMVIAVSDQAITWFTNDYREYKWADFNRSLWEYSTDRKTWHKCTVEEPA